MGTYTSPYAVSDLANMAGCTDPPVWGVVGVKPSRGAAFLRRVEDAAREAWEQALSHFSDDLSALADRLDEMGELHRIAGGAVPVEAPERWQAFTDLGAWQEDVSIHGDPDDNLTGDAGTALYLIADRLVRALIEEWTDDAAETAN